MYNTWLDPSPKPPQQTYIQTTLEQLEKVTMEWILDDIMKFVLIFLDVIIILWLTCKNGLTFRRSMLKYLGMKCHYACN